MRTIAAELTVFIIVLVVVIFIFSFFISWQIASLNLRIQKTEKDLNSLGEQIRLNRAHLISRLTRHQEKYNELVSTLELSTKFKDYPSSND